jgi:hypothetical protein
VTNLPMSILGLLILKGAEDVYSPYENKLVFVNNLRTGVPL